MTQAGAVTVSVRLGLEQLQRDALAATQQIKASIKDVQAPVAIKLDKSGLNNLAADVLKARANLTADAGESALLQRQAALLSEAVRFKQQLADIENAYVDPEDITRAKQLAAELYEINRAQIDRDYPEIVPPKGLAGQAQAFQDAVSEASLYTQALRDVSQELTLAGDRINAFTSQARAAAVAFDDARAKVATLSSDADGLASTMQELAAELNYQVNSTDLLNASYDVLSSGFSDTADVAGILKASAQGAQGGFSDIGTVADATTTILNSFKLSASEAARVVDILAQTQDKGKITIDQYAQQVGRAASIAAQAGISFEEFSAAVATATAKGVPAESAVSGARQAIVNLLKPTDEAKNLLNQFGIANSSAALQSQGLVGILQQLADQGATTDQLSKIFSDVDAFATVATLAGTNLKDFTANLDAMNSASGKAAASAEQVANSFSGQVALAMNQANEALVSLGKGVNTALVPLLKALTFLVENFNKLPEPVKQSIGLLIALTGGALTLAGAIAGIAATLPILSAGFKALGLDALFAGKGLSAAGAGGAASSAGLKGVATAAAASAASLGAMVAAAAAVALVVNQFSEITEAAGKTRASIESVEDALNKLETTQAPAAPTAAASPAPDTSAATTAAEQAQRNLEAIEDNLNIFARGLDAVIETLNSIIDQFTLRPLLEEFAKLEQIPEPVRRVLNAVVDRIPQLGTAAEAAVSRADAAFEDLVGTGNRVLESFSATDLSKATADQRKALSEAIAAQIAALEQARPVEEEDISVRNAQIATLKEAQAELENLANAQGGAADATAAAAAAAQQQAAALQKVNDDFATQSGAIDRANTERLTAIQQAVADGVATEEEGRQQSLESERRYLDERLALNEQKLAQLQTLKASTEDPTQQKELGQQILEVENQIASDRLNVATKAAEARVDVERRALEEIRKAQEDISLDETRQITQVRVQQATGAIDNTAADAQIEQIQAASIQKQIALINERLAAVRRGSGEERQLTIDLAQLQEQSAEQAVAAQERAARAIVEAYREARDAIDLALTQDTTEVKVRQASGDISEGDAAAEIAQLQLQATQDSIAALQERLAVVRRGSDEEKQLIEELADLQSQAADQQIDQARAIARARLEAVEAANRAAQSAIETSQTTDISAIRAAQQQRVISAEAAEQQIAQVQLRGLDQQLQQTQRQIAIIEQLRAEGVLNEADAIEQLEQLQSSAAEQNLRRIDAEIAAQQRLRQSKLDQELGAAQASAQSDTGALELETAAIANQNTLLQAQSGLLQAQTDLRQQRLQQAIAEAEADGRTGAAERLRLQLIDEQIAADQASAELAQEQLKLKREQLALDVERQAIAAELAATEARIALATAETNGENQQIIDGLRQVLSLRQQQRDAIDASASAQERALQLEEQALGVQQRRSREALEEQRRRQERQSGRGSGATRNTGTRNDGRNGFGFDRRPALPRFAPSPRPILPEESAARPERAQAPLEVEIQQERGALDSQSLSRQLQAAIAQPQAELTRLAQFVQLPQSQQQSAMFSPQVMNALTEGDRATQELLGVARSIGDRLTQLDAIGARTQNIQFTEAVDPQDRTLLLRMMKEGLL